MERNEDLRAKTKQVLLEYFSLIPADGSGKLDTPGIDTRDLDHNNSPALETVKSDFPGGHGRILVKSPTGDIFSRSAEQRHDTVVSDDRVLEKRLRGNKSVPWLFKPEEDGVSDLLKHFVQHAKHENGKIVARSKSFESAKYYFNMRRKMQQLLRCTVTEKASQDEVLLPVVGKRRVRRAADGEILKEGANISNGLNLEIDAVDSSNTALFVEADKKIVFHVGDIPTIVVHPPESDEDESRGISNHEESDLSCSRCAEPKTSKRLKPRTNLSIVIPKHNTEDLDNTTESTIEETRRPDMLSANTYAVNLLEEMSMDLMTHFPNLLNGPINDLLAPLREHNELPYEFFASAVRRVFSLQLAGVFTNVWQKMSLVMELVKETMVVGNFDENMMEVMVEYSTKFFMENIVESVEEEGGWDVLNVREMHGRGMRGITERKNIEASLEEQGKGKTSDRGIAENVTSYRWLHITIALLGVGLGLIYGLRRRLM